MFAPTKPKMIHDAQTLSLTTARRRAARPTRREQELKKGDITSRRKLCSQSFSRLYLRAIDRAAINATTRHFHTPVSMSNAAINQPQLYNL